MTSKQLAYFQVYPADLILFLAKTGEPPEITGVRLRLWAFACEEIPCGTLPDDEAELARFANLSVARWRRVAPAILKSWSLQDGRWVIRRLHEQWLHKVEVAKKRSGAGAAGGRPLKANASIIEEPQESKPKANAFQEDKQTESNSSVRARSPAPAPAPAPAKERTPRSPPSDPPLASLADSRFAEFWAAYPRKVGKEAARKAWLKANPPLDRVLATIAWQRQGEQWQKDSGQFIPNPATWINQGRWADEPSDRAGPEPKGYAGLREYIRRQEIETAEVIDDEDEA